jgi:protein SCO1/2
MRKIALSLIALTLVPLSAHAYAQDQRPPLLRDVGIDQRLDNQVPLDLLFRNESGETVELRRYLNDKPVILSLAYYECPMLCTLVLNGLVSALRALSFDVGKHFEVVTVSFDPTETPELARAKKETYLRGYKRPGAERGWHFLTGDADAIARLADAVGFRYRYDAERDEYAHAAGVIVLTPTGRVARYFYGVEFAPRDLRFGLIEAAQSRIGTPVDQLLLFCYRYDATTGRYSAAVMNLVRLGGLVTVLALGGFMLVMLRRERHSFTPGRGGVS